MVNRDQSVSPVSLMNGLCRGLVAYVSYLAACKQSTTYSEYILYGPIARIAAVNGFKVHSEAKVGLKVKGRGDYRRLDFVLTKGDRRIAIEVKWLKKWSLPSVGKDIAKLKEAECSDRFLLVFGPGSAIKEASLEESSSSGKFVEWNSGRTHYAARWFRIKA